MTVARSARAGDRPRATAPALIALLALCATVSCATQRAPVGGQFPFSFDGVEYVILSFLEPSGTGSNYLVRRDGAGARFRAADLDQDGTIEMVLSGTVSVEEANRLYRIGLAIARSGGKIDDRAASRLYISYERDRVLTVRTVLEGPSTPLNTFTVSDSGGQRIVVATDEGADGVLDHLVEGEADLRSLQAWYAAVLEQGLLVGRVQRQGRLVVVIPAGEP